MFGVPFEEEGKVLCENTSAITNSSFIESTLKKKHSLLDFPAVIWAVSADIIKVGCMDEKFNTANAFTK